MYRRILVPIDGSPASAQGIEEAIRLARPMRSRVRLLHAIDDLSVSRAGFAHDRSPELRAELIHVFRSCTAAEWEKTLDAAGVPAARVRSLDETLAENHARTRAFPRAPPSRLWSAR